MYLLPERSKLLLLIQFGFFCVILPGISFVIMRTSRLVSSVEMEKREERKIPIIVTFVYCVLLYFSLVKMTQQVTAPKYIFALPISGAVVAAAYFFLNMWKKISIHAGAAGIMTGFLLAYILLHADYQLWILAVAILISGVVMTARLYLEKHTLNEVISGWLIGTFLTFVVNYFY